MSVRVTFALIFAGLNGIQSLKTVDRIMMEVGETVQIPCAYEEMYMYNVKYLCRGSSFGSCTFEIRSDQINSSKYSINDDKQRRIVTFTIKNLELKDSEYTWWCAVERTGADEQQPFQLSVVRKNESKLSVDSQWIMGYFDRITINFKYKGSGLKKWCRFGGKCLHIYGKMDGAQVSVERRDAGACVTMTGLKAQNIGWYYFDSEELQMPVFLQVTERPTTTTSATTTTMSTPAFSTNKLETASTSDYITAAATALVLLILIMVVSSVAWFILKRKGKTEVEPSVSPECADYPVYSNVTPRSTPQNSSAANEMEVLYSSVTFNSKASEKRGEKEEDVLYSTLAQH